MKTPSLAATLLAVCLASASVVSPARLTAAPSPTISGKPALGFKAGPGTLELNWDTSAKGYWLQAAPTLTQPGAYWSLVTSAPNPIAGPGSYSLSTDNSVASFFQLAGPERVDVPILEPADRIPSSSLTVLLKPESVVVEMGSSVTFAALVDGFTNSPSLLTFSWEWNKSPYTTNFVTTNQTWRTLDIGSDTNFVIVPGSPTTNSFFNIPLVTTNEVAYYRVTVTAPGPITNTFVTATSAAAPMWAWQKTNSIVVYGAAVQARSGTFAICSTTFAYVAYSPGVYPNQPVLGPYLVSDPNNYSSAYWTDYKGIKTGSSCQFFVPLQTTDINPTLPYYFTFYIPNGGVIPSPYGIYFQNFH